jgi:hypothetical protein
MVASWGPVIARLRKLSREFDRPLLFTEIGYCAKNCSRVSSQYEKGGDWKGKA